MDFESIINKYAASHGISAVTFERKSLCRFLVNNQISVALEKALDEKGFFLYAVLGKLPSSQELVVALAVLEGNLFGKETAQCSIGYDTHTNSLVLFRYFDIDITDDIQFSHGFDEFLKVYAHWAAKLKTLG